MEIAGQIIINGLQLSAFYGILAIGLTLLFGVMKMFNMSHGELYMVGAYGVWLFYTKGGFPFLAAVALSAVVVGVLGLIIERGLFRPLRQAPMSALIGTVGIIFILQVTVGQIWGVGWPKPVAPAYPMDIEFFGIYFGVQRIVIIPIGFALLWGLRTFLHRMKVGQALRAFAQDAETASLQGININTMGRLAMILGCALAGVAGAFMAPLVAVDPYMGANILLKCFVVVIVGGLGSIEGSMVAALLFGFVDSTVTTLADSVIANMADLLVLVLVLVIRPKGVLGRGE